MMDQSQIFQGEGEPHQLKGEDRYKKIKVLGEGSMGKAYIVECISDNKLYVMKRINIGHLNPQQKQSAIREAELHSLVQHNNIIAFKEIYHTTKDKLCIIMEYAEGGDLDNLIQHQKDIGQFLNEDAVLNYFVQICMGLREIHSKKIIHRDLKGANIFLTTDKIVKIGDFGISKVIDQTVQASKSFVGTPYYLSPEMVEGKPYSTKADIWALGVLLYNISSQRLPFQANSLPLLALRILKGSFPPLSGPYSKELKALILSMLQVDAKKRPSASQLLMKPILCKHVPKEVIQSIQQGLKQKTKLLPRNQTVGNLANQLSPISTAKVVKKSSTVDKTIIEEGKKQKQSDVREEKRMKRNQDLKQMRNDIRKRRNELHKDKSVGSSKNLESMTQKQQNLKGNQKKQLQNETMEKQQQTKKTMQKPWKNIKNKNNKKQIEVQVLLPPIRSKEIKKQEQKAIDNNFTIQIKQFGKRQTQKAVSLQIEKEQSEQIQESVNEQSEQLDFEHMMNHLNHAQEAVRGLKGKGNKEIQLYEQSSNFDDQIEPQQKKNKFPDMNAIEEQSWNFIRHSDNLQQCRQILEQGLGEDRFIKAYNILSEHLQQSEYKKMKGQQLQEYTFNRQILRQKLQFLDDKQFHDYVVLMYTLIVIELEQMKKNNQT